MRGCGEALAREGAELVCPRRHSFSVARSGYVNLLQPQDKKSKHPGDSKDAVDARRRLLDAGLGDALVERLRGDVLEEGPLLDVGCGEGTFLEALARGEGWGVDLSTPAIDAAAKRHRSRHFVIANADRALPFAEKSFATITSITARRNATEFARILAPGGRVVVVVPGEDDQRELRDAVLGSAAAKERPVELPGFAVVREYEVRAQRRLEAPALRDLLASTYRGQRRSAEARIAALGALDLTFHWQVRTFRAATSSK